MASETLYASGFTPDPKSALDVARELMREDPTPGLDPVA